EASTAPVANRISTGQAVAETNSRSASELVRIARRCQEISEPPDGLDDIDPDLLANAADEHLDSIGIAVEILIVEMLHQLGARHYAPGVVHQVRLQPVFVRREFDWIAFDRHPAGARVESYRPAIEFALGMPGRAP